MNSPDQASRQDQASRVLLLVDDEKNILAALRRLLHQEKYRVLTASTGLDALKILASTPVDVIVSDQRMPEMTGVEFFRIAKEAYPTTIRIMLSGYTELQSVTDAINEGAIYKFLTKPWDDMQLKEHISEAFRRKELADENLHLNRQLHIAYAELAATNSQLDALLQQKELRIESDEITINIAQEVLQHLPLAVIGLDEDNLIVLANATADSLFAPEGPMLGKDITAVIPSLLNDLQQDGNTGDSGETQKCLLEINNESFMALLRPMGRHSQSRGKLLALIKQDGKDKAL
ncbi:MAG: response regulator [Herbaspirillum sp.]|nr:response regulator [Herbaspirillum sp.]